MNDGAQKRKPGRPPSTQAREKALHAARNILHESGLGALTIEAVASRSGTGKPTLYRHWANALELGMDALIADMSPALPPDLENAPRAAIIRQLDRFVEVLSPPRGRQIVHALALCDAERAVSERFRIHVLDKSRDAARETILHFVARGQLQAPRDMDILLDSLFAPLFFRVLTGHGVDKALPAQLVDTAFAPLEPGSPREGHDT
ncbi:MAG: TetR/AcrR family transcriptional regulator [Arenibacterium sp.]